MEKQNINSSKDKEKNSSRQKGMKIRNTTQMFKGSRLLHSHHGPRYIIDNKTISVHVNAA